MGKFITKKVIKVKRYQILLFLFCFFSIIFFSLYFLFHKVSFPIIPNIVHNSFGIKENLSSLFFKNSYGFSILESKTEDKPVSNLILEDENPKVYLYNTFQTMKYKSHYYASYTTNPVVTRANLILQEYLKKEGIVSIVETSSVAKVLKENNIPYASSYQGSKILLTKAYEEYPTLKYFFDIQLTSDSLEETSSMMNEERYAKILFVVGCANERYQENLKLAKSLDEKLNKYQLSRGIREQCGSGYHGVYNQDFHPNSLLIYIGGEENSIEEVNRTLKIFASILKEEIRGD